MNLRLKLALTIVVVAVPVVFATEKLRVEWEQRALVERLHGHLLSRFEDGGGIEACAAEPYTFGGVGSLNFWYSRARTPTRQPFRIIGDSLWAYDIGYVSDNVEAPPFPEDLRTKLRSSRSHAAIWREASPPMSSRAYWGQWIEAERKRFTARMPPQREGRRRGGERRDRSEAAAAAPEDENSTLPYLEFATYTVADDGPCAVVYVSGWVDEDPGSTTWWWVSYGLAVTLISIALFAAGPIVGRIRALTDDVNKATGAGYEQRVRVRGNDEIARLATAFNTASERIRDQINRVADREATLRKFVANTTHDVMIPLTVLQGHLSSLDERLPPDFADARAAVTKASSEAHYLGSILQNLAAVSKLEGADYQLRSDPVRLDSLVERVVGRHEPIAKKQGIEISHATPAEATVVRGDVTLLEQAVSNVVHNAVRYNDEGGHVAVLLDVSDQSFTLRVIDDGKNLDLDEITRLADRQFRGAVARTRNPDGNGLGLHIAREVMSKHGFTMSLDRSDYGGLEVVFQGQLAS